MDSIRTFVGDCIVSFENFRDHIQCGWVAVVTKPDRTVLVHDAGGYQPVVWLIRVDSPIIKSGPGPFGPAARVDDRILTINSNDVTDRVEYPASDAGIPVGSYLDTGDLLTRTNGSVVVLDSGTEYRFPAGVTVFDETCDGCSLPLMCVERGAPPEVCIDRRCDPLDDHVKDRSDGERSCLDCGSSPRAPRQSGRLLAGCNVHPECETAFSFPASVAGDNCDCGLPAFETGRDRRRLDSTYEGQWAETRGGERDLAAGDMAGREGYIRGRGCDRGESVVATATIPAPSWVAPLAS